MYTDDLISREALNAKIRGDKQETVQFQSELQMV